MFSSRWCSNTIFSFLMPKFSLVIFENPAFHLPPPLSDVSSSALVVTVWVSGLRCLAAGGVTDITTWGYGMVVSFTTSGVCWATGFLAKRGSGLWLGPRVTVPLPYSGWSGLQAPPLQLGVESQSQGCLLNWRDGVTADPAATDTQFPGAMGVTTAGRQESCVLFPLMLPDSLDLCAQPP